jgi:hypothetical protein
MNSDTNRMMQMITGYWITQIVHALATFSLADHLAKGPATAEDIARFEGIDPLATSPIPEGRRIARNCHA